MQSHVNIDLVDEILPVSLLRCKSAINALKPQEQLSIRTDDLAVVKNLAKFIRGDEFRIVRQEKSGDATIVVIYRLS